MRAAMLSALITICAYSGGVRDGISRALRVTPRGEHYSVLACVGISICCGRRRGQNRHRGVRVGAALALAIARHDMSSIYRAAAQTTWQARLALSLRAQHCISRAARARAAHRAA